MDDFYGYVTEAALDPDQDSDHIRNFPSAADGSARRLILIVLLGGGLSCKCQPARLSHLIACNRFSWPKPEETPKQVARYNASESNES